MAASSARRPAGLRPQLLAAALSAREEQQMAPSSFPEKTAGGSPASGPPPAAEASLRGAPAVAGGARLVGRWPDEFELLLQTRPPSPTTADTATTLLHGSRNGGALRRTAIQLAVAPGADVLQCLVRAPCCVGRPCVEVPP